MRNPEQGSAGRRDKMRRWAARGAVAAAAVFAAGYGLRSAFSPQGAAAQAPAPAAPAGPVGPQPAKPAGPVPAKPVLRDVARVNNQVIRRIDLGDLCVRRFGRDVLDTLVNRKLIEQHCARTGVAVTEKEVDEEIERIAKRFELPKDQYVKLLQEERNVSYERYARDIVWPTIALRRLAAAQLVVTPEEMQIAYESQYGPAVQVRWIILDDAKEAGEVRAKAVAAPDQFPRLAIDHSKDYASASAGGLIQPIRRHVGFVEVEKVAFTLQEGEVSDVFQLGKQFVIVKCEKQIAPRPVPLQQVEALLGDAIKERKLRQAGHDVFKQIKETASVQTIYSHPDMAQKAPEVAAFVNNEPIPLADLAEECIARNGKEMLDALIARRLLEQELVKRNLTMGQIDLDQELGHAAKQAGMMQGDVPDIARLVKSVCEERDVPEEAYIQELVWPVAALKKLSAGSFEVTAEDMQRGFDANFGEKMMCRAIVLDNQRRAREVWEMARRNPTVENFEQLAEQYSMDPSTRGMRGTIPPIHKHCGEPLLEKEAFRLNPGELSSVLQIDQRFVIMYCVGRTKPIAANIDEPGVKQAIYEDIFDKKQRIAMNETMEKIREAATIDNFVAGTTQRPGKSMVDGTRPPAPGLPNTGPAVAPPGAMPGAPGLPAAAMPGAVPPRK